MHRILKVAGYVAGALVAVTVIAAGGVYTVSERTLHREYDTPLTWTDLAHSTSLAAVGEAAATADPAAPADLRATADLTPTADAAAYLEEGRRLAILRGCYGGCHGTAMEGQVFFDEPALARIAAPNLTIAVREYSDAELERVIRRGVKRDRRSVFAMPSPMFSHLADEDYVAIVAFLRSQDLVEGDARDFVLGPIGRVGVALRKFPPLATQVQPVSPRVVPRHDQLEWGRYLALTLCSECHGADLRGDPDGGSPDLRIVAAFGDEAWEALLRTGRGLGDRELGLMGSVARSRFLHLTDDEASALRVYLRTLADA